MNKWTQLIIFLFLLTLCYLPARAAVSAGAVGAAISTTPFDQDEISFSIEGGTDNAAFGVTFTDSLAPGSVVFEGGKTPSTGSHQRHRAHR